MRVRIFTAPTLDAAKQQVRQELGEDAIILGIETPCGAPVRVTAGLDDDVLPDFDEPLPEPDVHDPARADDVLAEIRHALSFHGVPRSIAARLATTAEQVAAEAPPLALAGALQAHFRFAPLTGEDGSTGRPLMLIGPPGAGKTLAVAKLTTRLRRAGRDAVVISADRRRAGGTEELAALTRILGIELREAGDDAQLAAAVGAADAPTFIDTAGTNPFDPSDQAMLADAAAAAGAEPVLVLAAGGDPMESVDVAAAYADLGVRRLLISKLDLARRFGGLLAAADAAGAAFSEAGISWQVADGLCPLNAVTLARLVLPDATPDSQTPLLQEAEI